MSPRRRIIPVFIPHLGCPQNCIFCNQKHISGEKRQVSTEEVRTLIADGLTHIPYDAGFEIAFYGGSFTAIPVDEQIAFLSAANEFLHLKGLGEIRISTRPDAIDEEILERLRRFHVTLIELGSQSMDDEVLRLSNRGHTRDDTIRAAKLIKASGFKLGLQMMTGLPGDSFEKSVETAKAIINLKPDCVRIYPTVIVKDTELYQMWLHGEYAEHTPDEAAQWCGTLLDLFDEADIPVIRVGLNPTDELSGGEAVGGAYHPALGEMARSACYLNAARKLLENELSCKDAVIGVAFGQVSAMTGQKKINIITLCKEFELNSLKIIETNVDKGCIVLLSGGQG